MTATRQRTGNVEVSGKVLALAVRDVKLLTKRFPQIHLGTDAGDFYVEAGTSFDHHARAFVNAELEDDFDAVVSVGDLEAALKGAASDQITLSVDDEGVTFTTGRRAITLHDLADDDFRGLEYLTGELLFHGGPPAIDMLQRAATHASSNETRPVLTGTYLQSVNGQPTQVVTTDSYRLFFADLPGERSEPFEVLLDTKLLGAALKTIGRDKGFDLYDAGTHVVLDTGLTQWRMRKIEDQFPNYRQLVPDEFDHRATVDRDPLLKAVTAAARFLTANTPLRLSLAASHELTVEAAGADSPRSVETIAWSGMKPAIEKEFEIGLNPDFLAAALKVLDDEHLTLKVLTPLRPVLLTGDDAQVLLMPTRLGV